MAIRITVWIQGLFSDSGFVTVGRYGKWLTDINQLLILIRQTSALVRRALAEVCTVAVLLVLFLDLDCFYFAVRAFVTKRLRPFIRLFFAFSGVKKTLRFAFSA